MQNAKGFFKGSCISSHLEYSIQLNKRICGQFWGTVFERWPDFRYCACSRICPCGFTLLSGYIADNFIGRYRSAKIAFTLLFVTSILQCILVVVKQSIAEVPHSLSIGLGTFTSSLGSGSAAILLVTLPQICLDQMTDNSVSNITSFIAWFVASFFIGSWISGFSYTGSLCFGGDFQTVLELVICR